MVPFCWVPFGTPGSLCGSPAMRFGASATLTSSPGLCSGASEVSLDPEKNYKNAPTKGRLEMVVSDFFCLVRGYLSMFMETFASVWGFLLVLLRSLWDSLGAPFGASQVSLGPEQVSSS